MRRITLALVILIFALGPAAGQKSPAAQEQRIVVPLTDPSRPVRLEVDLFSAQVEVEGYEGREVVILARNETMEIAPTAGGMKRIPNTALGLTVEEHENEVSVSGDWSNQSVLVRIQVPFRTSAAISSVNAGDIVVRRLSGEIELQNTNGGIEATDIRGSVVAQTTNGGVRVTFAEIDPGKPMSFSTLNGDVDVTFPPGLKADLRIEPGRGDILTDFDFELLPAAPQVERSESGGAFRVDVGQDVRAKVGGGGPTFRFKTFNGTIYIRKSRG